MPSKRDVPCKGKGCNTLIARENKRGLCRGCYEGGLKEPTISLPPAERMALDREKNRLGLENASLKDRYQEALKTIDSLEHDLAITHSLHDGIDPFTIEPQHGTGTSEGTVCLTASDWHVEERVDPARVSGLNEYNLEIAKERATTFFQGGIRLTRLLAQDIKIQNMILPLLGDFISNDIHEEFPEINEVAPTHAIVHAQNFLISGIESLLNHTKVNLVLPCHSGNHGRTTKTTRFGNENGHSLEYLMYLHLAAYFRREKRVTFRIAEGYHSYLDVYGKTIRFHHGHAIKYAGGVGGITIPVNKAVAQWDKARPAALDVFGHFHQQRDGGKWICNGSMIGYNSFALSIKADYEPPKQALFLLDKKRGRTCTWPIWFKR